MTEVSGGTIMWDYHFYVKTLISGRAIKEIEAEYQTILSDRIRVTI